MPSPSGAVDLRSDTVTPPTSEMRRAMADAEVGDDAYGEDPTVRRLESLAAALLGKEAALVPSGAMANSSRSGFSAGPADVLCGESPITDTSRPPPETRIQPGRCPTPTGWWRSTTSSTTCVANPSPPGSRRFALETRTCRRAAARGAAELDAVIGSAREHGLAVHCDGARIWNASIALAVPPAVLAARTNTVMFCLSKGLSAPVGSLLCGDSDAIAAAREDRSRLGGGMRQTGVIAAAGVVALETMVDRLADDHGHARRLRARDRFPGGVDPLHVGQHHVRARRGAEHCCRRAWGRGTRGTIDVDTLRFVTHKASTTQMSTGWSALDEPRRPADRYPRKWSLGWRRSAAHSRCMRIRDAEIAAGAPC
jgi:threonine aldolase